MGRGGCLAHYLSRPPDQSPFGLRIYSQGVIPVITEGTVVAKYTNGVGQQTLPNKGESMGPLLLFSKEGVDFQGMFLQRQPGPPITMDFIT